MTIFYFYAFLLPVVGIHSALVVHLGGFSLCDFVKNWFNLFFGYLHLGLIIAFWKVWFVSTRHTTQKQNRVLPQTSIIRVIMKV